MMADPKLPALATALDDQLVSRKLNADLAFLAQLPLAAPITVTHQLLKHAPGKRCVVAYQLQSQVTGAQMRVIGKLYRENRGEAVFRHMQQLGVAHPLHYVPSLGLVLQQHMPGRPLAEMLDEADLAAAVVAVGRQLAVLHGTALPGLTVRATMAAHLTKYCRPLPSDMVLPGLQPTLAAVLARLLDGERLADLPLVTVHNDLNLLHVYWHQGQPLFIDFDGLCLSHAALDVANFRVALGIYLPERGAELGALFLRAYLAEWGGKRVPGLPEYEALAYLRRATICYRKRLDTDWQAETVRLVAQAWGALGAETAVVTSTNEDSESERLGFKIGSILEIEPILPSGRL